MKLIDIVKRIENAGLSAALTIHSSDGRLYLRGYTVPGATERYPTPSLVFCCVIDGGKSPSYWTDASIVADIEKAARRSDAVARRELMAQCDKEEAADNAKA